MVESCLKPCPHCRRKVRLSHKSETVAENGDSATVAENGQKNGESRTFMRQCGQGFTEVDNVAVKRHGTVQDDT